MNLKMQRDGKSWRKKCANASSVEEKIFPQLCECVVEDELIELVTVLPLTLELNRTFAVNCEGLADNKSVRFLSFYDLTFSRVPKCQKQTYESGKDLKRGGNCFKAANIIFCSKFEVARRSPNVF